jgi:hypothetical protein
MAWHGSDCYPAHSSRASIPITQTLAICVCWYACQQHTPCLTCCSEEEDKPLLTKGLLEQKAGGQAGQQSHVLKWMAGDMGADDDEADDGAAQVSPMRTPRRSSWLQQQLMCVPVCACVSSMQRCGHKAWLSCWCCVCCAQEDEDPGESLLSPRQRAAMAKEGPIRLGGMQEVPMAGGGGGNDDAASAVSGGDDGASSVASSAAGANAMQVCGCALPC